MSWSRSYSIVLNIRAPDQNQPEALATTMLQDRGVLDANTKNIFQKPQTITGQKRPHPRRTGREARHFRALRSASRRSELPERKTGYHRGIGQGFKRRSCGFTPKLKQLVGKSFSHRVPHFLDTFFLRVTSRQIISSISCSMELSWVLRAPKSSSRDTPNACAILI